MFEASKLKVERAEKHIFDLYTFLQTAPKEPDFYTIAIDKIDVQWGINDLVVTVRATNLASTCALILGDVFHNLRSSLDMLFYEVVIRNEGGEPTKWTRFPIMDTGDELVGRLNTILERRQISKRVRDFILDVVKPYQTGNFRLWALDDMNITDKHKLFIPTFKAVGIEDISLNDDKKGMVPFPVLYVEKSCTIRLDSNIYGWNPTLENKGSASVGVGFQSGTACEGQPVIPTLNAITKEVTRTIEAFEILLGR
jgi:hypothetical protein